MSAFVLVPGACHGGWWFEPLARELRKQDHEAFSVTLAGVGERRHDVSGRVNLSTHITDVVALIEANELCPAVLVGHSYAGMVISGVADQVPARVAALVYVDAFVPSDGDSAYSLTSDDERRWFIEGASEDGLSVTPRPFFDRRATPHPLASLLQDISLKSTPTVPSHYIWLREGGLTPFAETYDRLSQDRSWRTHVLRAGHNVMRDDPDGLLSILLGVAADTDSAAPID